MAVSVPGLSLSILRQQTSVRSGLPLLTSGRFTVFGMGVPAYIRVFLEGPTYDPQIRSFDTFASPFSGDYSVNVIAEKDGQYNVYAQAFPPPIVPTGPPFPDAILLLPPLAESTRPPLVVGMPFNGGVNALYPDGTMQRLQAPPMQPIEFRPLITVGAPGVTVTIPGIGAVPRAAIPFFPALPGAPPAPALPPGVPAPPVAARPGTAAIDDVLFFPPLINPGQEATGTMAWRNTGDAAALFDTVFYLVSTTGARYGPLQVNLDVSAHPQVPNTQNLRLGTQGLPSGFYSVIAEVFDSATGDVVASRTLSARLQIREIVAPPIPVPPVPPPPVVPTVPTPDILGTPFLNLPNQLNVGDAWSGSVSLPTFGVEALFAEAVLLLRDPAGREIIVGQGGRTLSPGEMLQIPVDYNTTGFTAGNYTILLRVFDQLGNQIAEFPMGFLSMLEAVLPPVPEIPAPPTAPTADMFGTPSINLPSQVEIGEIWQGDISIPTFVPPALAQMPGMPSLPAGMPSLPAGMPSLPVDIGFQLQSPTGQMFDVGSFRPTFTPGQPINLPVNFDTGVLPQEGIHNLVMNIQDLQGNTLFSNVIGALRAMMPEIPLPPGLPEVPLPSKFSDVAVLMGPQQVQVGEPITVPFTFTHLGAPEVVTLRAAIGDDRPAWMGGLDEVWWADKTVSVEPHPIPTPIREEITIQITPKFRAGGIYSVYAKVDGGIPKAISPVLANIIEVVEPAAPPVPVPPAPPAISRFTSIQVNISPQQVEEGDPLRVPVSYIHTGRGEDAMLYAAIGQMRGPVFDEILSNRKPISVPLDEAPTARGDEIEIQITDAIAPGTYHVQAKVTDTFPEAVSEVVQNVVEVIGPPEVPWSQFPSCSVQIGIHTLQVGDTLQVPVRFVHSGERERISVYAAIGNYSYLGFDQVLQGEVDWAVPDDMTPQARTVTVPITITSAIRPGTYAVYGKVIRIQTGLGETVSQPILNVIEIAEPAVTAPSQFSNISVAYPTAPVSIGGSVRLQVNFMHQGQGESEWLYAAIGNTGVFGFDEILSNRRAISVPDEEQTTFHTEFIDIPVTTAIRRGSYDVYAKIGLGVPPRAISPTTQNVIRVI